MKRLLLLMIVFFGGIVQVVAENTLFYDSKQLTCDLITSICQDKDGFIWIGTDYGLNKFNGIQFTHYYNIRRGPSGVELLKLHNKNPSGGRSRAGGRDSKEKTALC